MQNLVKDSTRNNMTVTAQVPAPTVTETDSKTLQGSHQGDHRGQTAQPDPLKGNDRGPRDSTGSEGS